MSIYKISMMFFLYNVFICFFGNVFFDFLQILIYYFELIERGIVLNFYYCVSFDITLKIL